MSEILVILALFFYILLEWSESVSTYKDELTEWQKLLYASTPSFLIWYFW